MLAGCVSTQVLCHQGGKRYAGTHASTLPYHGMTLAWATCKHWAMIPQGPPWHFAWGIRASGIDAPPGPAAPHFLHHFCANPTRNDANPGLRGKFSRPKCLIFQHSALVAEPGMHHATLQEQPPGNPARGGGEQIWPTGSTLTLTGE